VTVSAPGLAGKINSEGTVKFTVAGDNLCRLKAEVKGTGWEVMLFNELAAPTPGNDVTVPVFVKSSQGCSRKAIITLTAISESDNTLVSKADIRVNN
jgi:hypothetical protein